MKSRTNTHPMINHFRDAHFFLSNFYESPCKFEGLMFGSVEAAFQAAKVLDIETRRKFTMLSPSEAKKLGRQVELRPDWEEVKDRIMFDCVLSKFTETGHLAIALRDTGDAILTEGNTWCDNYWGICGCAKCRKARVVGKNQLGITLMQVRKVLFPTGVGLQ